MQKANWQIFGPPSPTTTGLSLDTAFTTIGDSTAANQAIELDNAEANTHASVTYSTRLPHETLGKLRNAIPERSTVSPLLANRPEAYLDRGMSKNKQGDTKGALADLNRPIELNPSYADAYFARAMLRSSLGEQ